MPQASKQVAQRAQRQAVEAAWDMEIKNQTVDKRRAFLSLKGTQPNTQNKTQIKIPQANIPYSG